MTKRDEKLLTETELELMNILWEIKEGTVRDVISRLPKGRDLAYTSVSTILRILEKKTVLKSVKVGKSHIYSPVVKRESYQKKGLNHLIENVFSGAPSSLIRTLLDSKKLKDEDLKALQELISSRIDS